MHPSLHHGNGNVAGLANHKLSGMTNRGRTRKCRDVRIGNADGVCKIVGKRAETRAEDKPDLRAQLRLGKDKRRCGVRACKQVWCHVSKVARFQSFKAATLRHTSPLLRLTK